MQTAKRNWVWSFFPINAGIAGFNTMLPLYVYQLGGNVVDVATTFAIFNLVVVPSSIFWGTITDRIPRRKQFFQVSYLGMGVIYVAMYEIPSLFSLAALYGLLAFVLVASIPASNLLVMETADKRSWSASFANFALVSNLGAAAGLLVGLIWTSFIPLGLFLVFCTGCAYLSLFLASVLVSEPPITLERASLRSRPWSLFSGLYHVVTNRLQVIGSLSTHSISMAELTRTYRMMIGGVSKGRTLLFFSTFFYMFSNALISTTYIPFLSSLGVSNSAVYAITLANVVLQILAYRLLTFLTRRVGHERTAIYSIIITGTSIFIIGGSALLLQGFSIFLANIVLFSLMGFGFALWNSATSVVLFTTLGTDRQAGLLGAYSALSGFGVVIGSVLSGFISFYFGYTIDFVLSSALTVFSLLVIEGAFKALGHKQIPPS